MHALTRRSNAIVTVFLQSIFFFEHSGKFRTTIKDQDTELMSKSILSTNCSRRSLFYQFSNYSTRRFSLLFYFTQKWIKMASFSLSISYFHVIVFLFRNFASLIDLPKTLKPYWLVSKLKFTIHAFRRVLPEIL